MCRFKKKRKPSAKERFENEQKNIANYLSNCNKNVYLQVKQLQASIAIEELQQLQEWCVHRSWEDIYDYIDQRIDELNGSNVTKLKGEEE